MGLAAGALWAPAAGAAPPSVSAVSVSEATTSSVKLSAQVNPNGKATLYHFEYDAEACPPAPNSCATTPKEPAGNGSVAKTVSVTLEGLPPGALYHARAVAENGDGESESPDRLFATYSEPLGGLPEARAYEQASPLAKNGLNAEGTTGLTRASSDGEGITFLSTFGIPGGVGAQGVPTYLASREGGAWSTKGLLPPATYGEGAQVLGWLPDLSVTYASATNFATPRSVTLLAEPKGEAPVQITPYVQGANFRYAGATVGGAVVFFEARTKLPPEEGQPPIEAALEKASNLYAWDRESGRVSLVSVPNDGSALPAGGFAGPYAWGNGTNAVNLTQGGALRGYYLQDNHAITPEGGIYFTEAGSGRLYLRENPTMPQSAVNGGECTEAGKACTVHVSASKRTIGGGEGGADSAGPQPAAFQAASADGAAAFFTSPELLTDDANTGPEQPPAAIGRCPVACEDPEAEAEAEFIPKRAVGLATDSEYVYWADPVGGAIGRAKPDDPEGANPAFIAPEPTDCGKEVEPGVREAEESKPRYVAVDSEYVYWTNAGCRDTLGKEETEGGGSIGRARLDGSEVDPEFIPGRAEPSPGVIVNQVNNPQGIAIGECAGGGQCLYWANDSYGEHRVARARIDGSEVLPKFAKASGGQDLFGVAVDAGHVYFASYEAGNNNGYVSRVSPAGGEAEAELFISKGAVLGLALDGAHLYWASQGDGAIGRASIAGFGGGACETTVPACERKFIELEGSPAGVALDPSLTHLYWSVNGEIPPNPGNDLYRFEPGSGALADLTPDPSGDGAEVQGVLGASPDGSRVYFVANGDLDGAGPASPGDCQTPAPHGALTNLKGHCSLYLWREAGGEAQTTFIARLSAENPFESSDTLDWAPTVTLSSGYAGRTSRLADEGRALLFRSREKLTGYDNEGVPELYLHREGRPLTCVSCDPSGEAPGEGPGLGQIEFIGGIAPGGGIAAVTRNLSADGDRVFFETAESLTPADANGEGCTVTDGYRSCMDVYEWEAEGSGECKAASPSYSPLDRGCLYLISKGTEQRPSLLGDASESGDDVFFFSFGGLVGQDKDELRDVYDARVGGGIASQNPPPAPPPCESAEACHGPAQQPPAEATPATPSFHGPPDPKPKRGKAKRHHKKHRKHHRKKKHAHNKGKKHRAKAHAGRRAGK